MTMTDPFGLKGSCSNETKERDHSNIPFSYQSRSSVMRTSDFHSLRSDIANKRDFWEGYVMFVLIHPFNPGNFRATQVFIPHLSLNSEEADDSSGKVKAAISRFILFEQLSITIHHFANSYTRIYRQKSCSNYCFIHIISWTLSSFS
jgi:hypothetical protein